MRHWRGRAASCLHISRESFRSCCWTSDPGRKKKDRGSFRECVVLRSPRLDAASPSLAKETAANSTQASVQLEPNWA